MLALKQCFDLSSLSRLNIGNELMRIQIIIYKNKKLFLYTKITRLNISLYKNNIDKNSNISYNKTVSNNNAESRSKEVNMIYTDNTRKAMKIESASSH